ncbi:theronine dehydrogenase-like Zn-dependent dehydrogenase [Opitutaceae bacterium TAV1]|nr:theronine dehydrogenase-like Zn-dependent dehydrogenase [Opitutaceae bacterium TAV1]
MDTSQAIVIERPQQAAYRDIQLTPMTPDTIVCRTTWSAISSGTDMKTWRGQQHPEQCWYPLVPGYENVGIIEEIGPKANITPSVMAGQPQTPLRVGDRVMINECRQFGGGVCAAWGGNARIVRKNSHTAPSPFDYPVRIPDNVSDADAVLAYLACVALKGVRRLTLAPGDIVLVTGAGMIGISAAQIVKILQSAVTVIIGDRSPARLEIARHYADHVLPMNEGVAAAAERLRDITKGRMADKLIECTGNPSVVGVLHKLVKGGGWVCDGTDEPAHIHLQGDYPEPIVLDAWHRWFVTNCTLTMTCALSPGCKEQVLAWMSEGRFSTKHLPFETFAARDCHAAYTRKQQKAEDVFKILFKWD